MNFQKNINFVNKIILENAISCVIIILSKKLTFYIEEEKNYGRTCIFLGQHP